MTGGTVVVLGSTGKNFGAGMTGGEAFVLDQENKFLSRYNDQLVGAARIDSAEDEAKLKNLITMHHEKTASPQASRILADWKGQLAKFWKITPHVPTAKPIEKDKGDEAKTIITEHITASPKA
jgi:glutamate synthase domain-containing protein 3